MPELEDREYTDAQKDIEREQLAKVEQARAHVQNILNQ